jgi:hypothetical protein
MRADEQRSFTQCTTRLAVSFAILVGAALAHDAKGEDSRDIDTGSRIPDEGYCDMPYVAVTKNGNWLCTLTTGPGREGDTGQHVVSTISTDHGKTWSPLVDIEPSTGPKASWAMPLVTPSGRVYAFYNYNGDNITTLKGQTIRRTDHLGWYVYSGRSWTTPEPMTYAPGGPRIKNPVACARLWRTSNGKHLFWFHNHGGMDFRKRNPAWLCGGVEQDGKMHWSQPEIVLYGADPEVGMSYPDLVEQDGRYWITETQKSIARVHEIDRTLLEGLWSQRETKEVAKQGLLIESASREAKLPAATNLEETGGLSVEAWILLDYPYHPFASVPIVDTRDKTGRGFALAIAPSSAIRIELSDGQAEASWESDPGLLKFGVMQHVVAIVDAGPRIISFLVDGRLCDGGDARQVGWGRYEKPLTDVSGSGMLRVGPPVKKLRVYGRYLRTSEAVGNFHAGP